MALPQVNSYKKATDVILAAIFLGSAYLLQITVLNNFVFHGAICNLPLTITILWGYIFSENLFELSSDELRTKSAYSVFLHQVGGGSISGLLVGAFIAALYCSSLPIYPLCYPVIGWIAGYVKFRGLNQETLMCIPLTLFVTVLAELLMAWQLTIIGRTDALTHLAQFVVPEALLNALIAPFIYFPMRRWFDYYCTSPMES